MNTRGVSAVPLEDELRPSLIVESFGGTEQREKPRVSGSLPMLRNRSKTPASRPAMKSEPPSRPLPDRRALGDLGPNVRDGLQLEEVARRDLPNFPQPVLFVGERPMNQWLLVSSTSAILPNDGFQDFNLSRYWVLHIPRSARRYVMRASRMPWPDLNRAS